MSEATRRAARRRRHREAVDRRRATKAANAARREANPDALRLWIRWALRRVQAVGRDVAEAVIDEAIDVLADRAVDRLDIGDSPLADDVEGILSETIDDGGRALLHRIARSVLEEDDALALQPMIPVAR